MIKCSTVEPMKGILHLIHHLLQPLIKEKFDSKTFPTANEAIEALIKYTESNHLRLTTFFVTIQIHDLHSTLPHHLIIEALQHFFHYYKYDHQKIDGILTTTIIRLIELFLKNQYCLYEHKLYQQIIGSSIDLPLITTFIDIYLFYWQYDLLRRLGSKRNRCFGRCHNQIFFIWNDSKDELVTFLKQNKFIHSNYPEDIQMTVTIDYNIQYLDAEISHIQGRLQTRVYHHSNFEPYALPYLSKIKTKSTSTSSHIFVLLRAALIRAVLYCSNACEFENERLYIELSFLLNDVSLYLIQTIMANFFIEFHTVERDIFRHVTTYGNLRSQIQKHYQEQSKYHLRQRKQQQHHWLY
jgi:hypothetical protein